MSIQIACPKCGAELRLRDRRRLGQTGKCPQCEHRFVLREPDEVELELADKPAAAPAVGTAAQWVPDSGAAAATAERPAAPVGFTPAPVDPIRKMKARRKQARKRAMWGTVAALLVAAIGAGVYLTQDKPKPAAPAVAANAPAKPHATEPETLPEEGPAADDHDAAGAQASSKPIELLYVPSGARIIVNVHPAKLWKAGGLGEGEFVACLGPVGTWLAASLKELCQEEPAKIEEALIALIPTGRDTPPDVSVVVHLKDEAKKSDMIEKFGGERKDDLSRPYYVNGDKAYLLHDLQTYAIAPAALAEEMVRAAEYANPTDTGIEELLRHTNRERMFSVVFVPTDLRLYEQVLIPELARRLVQNVVDWLTNDDEVEAVVWSFDVDKKFSSQLLLRNAPIVRMHQLAKAFEAKLDATPHRILDAIRMMNPPEAGKRRVIGRVPAMSKAFALSTKVHRADRHLALATDLPERAGPNLALGTLLAWDESTRTDFNNSKSPTGKPKESSGAKVPDLIVDRFKTKIDIDFRNEFLYAAFDYIAAEAKFDITIDGDALKAGGFTKNMKQLFKMNQVPAGDAIEAILKQYKNEKDAARDMVIVVDEKKKLVTVTTRKFCEDKGLKPYEFKK